MEGVGRNPEELSRVSTSLTKLSGRGGGDYTKPSPQSHTRILLRHVPWEISRGLEGKKRHRKAGLLQKESFYHYSTKEGSARFHILLTPLTGPALYFSTTESSTTLATTHGEPDSRDSTPDSHHLKER